jgi:Dynamin GTPase effector domain
VTSIAVAYKRFVDNIPMGLDRTMLRGITVGLQDTLIKGLNISGSDGYQRCMMLLSEPEHIAELRTVLQNRRQRLVSARKELVEAFM